jgi:acetamidase/formamidase
MRHTIGVWLAAAFVGALGVIAPASSALAQDVHELKASPTNVHWGYFSAAVKPVLTIKSGDVVVIEDVPRAEPQTVEEAGVPPNEIPDNHRAIYREVKDRGPGPHILVGPVYVEGAEPGDVLEVRILEVELAYSYAYNRQAPYGGTLPDEFTHTWQRILRIDRQKKTSEVAPGVVIPLTRPFFGTMGVAPDPGMGRISSRFPGVHSGNLDNKDLGAGSILYMPVHAKGGLFSAGDGHAAQGQGEVDGTAVETGVRGRFQFFVRKGMKLRWPRAETPTHWIVMGLGPGLDEAMKIAVRETVDLLVERFPRLTREEAYMIASVAVDYHVTQVVNQTKGVHGLIPKAIFATP